MDKSAMSMTLQDAVVSKPGTVEMTAALVAGAQGPGRGQLVEVPRRPNTGGRPSAARASIAFRPAVESGTPVCDGKHAVATRAR
jgi:hypothetical protein